MLNQLVSDEDVCRTAPATPDQCEYFDAYKYIKHFTLTLMEQRKCFCHEKNSIKPESWELYY